MAGRTTGALLFVVEEETRPGQFSIHRLAHYCLDLAGWLDTERVVPVVIFLRADAESAQVERWLERILTANSPDELFG